MWETALKARRSIYLCDLTVEDRTHGTSAPPSLTVNDPLDPPDAQCDDEADSIPGAAGAVGHCRGHHGGQREYDDSSIKHLRKHTRTHTRTRLL